MKKRIISAAILPLLIASLAACSSTSSVAPTTDAPTTSETPTSETPVTSETPSSSEEPEPEPAPEPAVESITAADLHTAEILPNYVVSLTVRVDKILDTEESVKGSFLAADPFDGAPIVVAHSSLDASVLELTDKEDGTYKGTFDKSSDKLGLSITVGEGDAAVTTKVEAGDIVTVTGVATIVAGVDGKSCIGLNGVIDAASIQKSEFLTYRHKVNVSVVDETGAPVEGVVVNYVEDENTTKNGYGLWNQYAKFIFEVPEGHYVSSVYSYDYLGNCEVVGTYDGPYEIFTRAYNDVVAVVTSVDDVFVAPTSQDDSRVVDANKNYTWHSAHFDFLQQKGKSSNDVAPKYSFVRLYSKHLLDITPNAESAGYKITSMKFIVDASKKNTALNKWEITGVSGSTNVAKETSAATTKITTMANGHNQAIEFTYADGLDSVHIYANGAQARVVAILIDCIAPAA